MDDLKLEAVRSKILTAWNNLPTPSKVGDSETGTHLECDRVAQFFSGKRWEEVSWQELRKYKGDRSACLSFMSPVAYRYYLASYMLIALDNYDDLEIDVTADSAWYSLIPPAHEELNQHWASRVSGFNQDQKKAILFFLQFMLSNHGNDHFFDIESRKQAIHHWENFQ